MICFLFQFNDQHFDMSVLFVYAAWYCAESMLNVQYDLKHPFESTHDKPASKMKCIATIVNIRM